MVDINIASQQVTAVAGPSAITVQVGLGQRGQRGSRIFVGESSPQLFFVPEASTALGLELFDLYINTNPADEDYLYLYQFIGSDGGNVWEQIVRLVPNQVSVNSLLTFTAGSATLDVELLDYYPQSLIDELVLGTPSVVVSSESAFPVAVSVSDVSIAGTILSIDLVAAKLVGSVSALAEAVTINANVNFVFAQSEIS